jgi:hypothetical protein
MAKWRPTFDSAHQTCPEIPFKGIPMAVVRGRGIRIQNSNSARKEHFVVAIEMKGSPPLFMSVHHPCSFPFSSLIR